MTDYPPYPGDAYIQSELQRSQKSVCCRVWEEPEICVVLGRGGKAEKEIQAEALHADGVTVYRRDGGGGTVVLSPGMLVIAIAAHVKDPYGSKRYFQALQLPMIEALEQKGLTGISQRGLSDLAWNDRKILGSSMRRQRSLLVYQGVMLVNTDRNLFDRYLLYPPREPDYREGRSHQSFTTCLSDIGWNQPITTLQQHLETTLQIRVPQLLSDDVVTPP